MSGMKAEGRPRAAPQAEEAAIVEYSSPPCLLHELDPRYLGYLGRDEVLDLLVDLSAADLSGTRLEKAWVRAMLLRHIARVGGPRGRAFMAAFPWHDAGDAAACPATHQERLAARLQHALPRLEDRVLQQDLEQLLPMLRRDRTGDGLRQGSVTA
jgi:hypothetical protein